jgi:hypothetical protein
LYQKIEGRIIAEIRNRLTMNVNKILFSILSLEINSAFGIDFFELIIDIVKVVIFINVFVIDLFSTDDIVAFVGIEEIMRAVVVVVFVVILVIFFGMVVKKVVVNVVLVVVLVNFELVVAGVVVVLAVEVDFVRVVVTVEVEVLVVEVLVEVEVDFEVVEVVVAGVEVDFLVVVTVEVEVLVVEVLAEVEMDFVEVVVVVVVLVVVLVVVVVLVFNTVLYELEDVLMLLSNSIIYSYPYCAALYVKYNLEI